LELGLRLSREHRSHGKDFPEYSFCPVVVTGTSLRISSTGK